MIFISDLDNTLIHSYKKKNAGDICVEQKDGKQLSFMTPRAYDMLSAAAYACMFVPLTTRSIAQYRRLSLLKNCAPKYALVSNGATLLVNGKVDRNWKNNSKKLLAGLNIERFVNILKKDKNITYEIQLVDDCFVFGKSANANETMRRLEASVDTTSVILYSQKDKIYIIPRSLNKGAAVKRFIASYGGGKVVCAGDSMLDLPMLKVANHAFAPDNRLGNFTSPPPNTNFSEFVLTRLLRYCCLPTLYR